MLEFQCAPNVEVSGHTILAFAEAFPQAQRPMFEKILDNNGISVETVQGDQFYSYKDYLESLKTIRQDFGGGVIAKLGYTVVQHIQLPPEWTEIVTVLENIDAGYQMQCRGGDAGHYIFQGVTKEAGMTKATLVVDNPIPCEYVRGVFEGLAHRYPPKGGQDILVRHDDTQQCKKKGGTSCTWIISWWD